MNKRAVLFTTFAAILLTPSFAQEKSRRELRKERELERQQQVEALIESKDFVFIPQRAMPQGGRTIDLTTNPGVVKFQPELIESDMPYFGRAYSGTGYGGSTGMKFSGEPASYNLEEKRRNYVLTTQVKSGTDTYRLALTVSFSGGATLAISSNQRASISYSGEIRKAGTND